MSIFDNKAPHNDKVIIAHYDLAGLPHKELFSFGNLPAGSGARGARCSEYDRKIEALKGQGCQVHCWDTQYWPMYADAFFTGKLYKGPHPSEST